MASAVLRLLRERRETVAVAESLTGGFLGAALTDVAGASAVFRGGIVAYASDVKTALLGVDADLLLQRGAVDPDVAVAMARGVRDQLGATYGVATTGVAGPDPQDGQDPGTVFIACVGPAGESVVSSQFDGDRSAVREQTVAVALQMLVDHVAGRHG